MIRLKTTRMLHTLFHDSGIERCGVILGTYDTDGAMLVVRLAEMRNLHPEPENNFRISRKQVDRLMTRTLYAPLGYWHTHAEGHKVGPSDADMGAMARYPHHIGMVFHQPSRTVTWFNNIEVIMEEVI